MAVTDNATVLAARVEAVRARIAAAAARVGRDPSSVTLLPVSKTRPAAVVAATAAATGLAVFAENRPQELAAKAEELAGLGLGWVQIGPLQTNKAGLVAAHASQFQALDSWRVAEALDRRLQALGRGMDVLIEVNTSGEAAKHGVAPDDAVALASGLAPYTALRPRGVMTVAVNSQDEASVRACFRLAREVRARLRDSVPGQWDELSMGMSGDFEWAIEEGATIVRIGSAIFGPRPSAVVAGAVN